MKEGDRFKCRVDSVAFGGDGVAHIEDMVVFIPQVLPGELVEAKIRKIKKDYLKAAAVNILEPSPRRIVPECKYFKYCPGCTYAHADYPLELEMKLDQLKHILKVENQTGAAGIASVFTGTSGGDTIPAKRNKIVLHVAKERGETVLGYVSGNGSVADIECCLAANPEINAELTAMRSKPGFFHSLHDGMDVTLRYTENDGVVMWRNKPPRNVSWLKEKMPFGSFSVPAGSFSQVNPVGAAALLELLTLELKRKSADVVADVYCGAGLFGLQAALCGAKRVIGIESDVNAVAAAKYNFKQYGFEDKTEFIAGDAAEMIGEVAAGMNDSGMLIVDPPRGGMEGKVIGAIGASGVKRMVYISCNPSTLGRDLRRLAGYGFEAVQITMVNMFPRSGHFEVFTVLERHGR